MITAEETLTSLLPPVPLGAPAVFRKLGVLGNSKVATEEEEELAAAAVVAPVAVVDLLAFTSTTSTTFTSPSSDRTAQERSGSKNAASFLAIAMSPKAAIEILRSLGGA